MAQTHDIILKSNLLASEKKLTIQPGYIEFNNVNFSKLEIEAIRYGVKAIEGYRFTIGRTYCIDLKSIDGKIIKIRLTSIYGVRKKLLGEKYKTILNAIFENYLEDIAQNFIESFNVNANFILLGNTITQEGIILNKHKETIVWADLGTKDFWSYFLIFSIAKPDKYSTFYYLNDWNTVILKSVVRYILNSKGLL